MVALGLLVFVALVVVAAAVVIVVVSRTWKLDVEVGRMGGRRAAALASCITFADHADHCDSQHLRHLRHQHQNDHPLVHSHHPYQYEAPILT